VSNSTKKPSSGKAGSDRPKKPYPDFPLSPHASGTWQKKIRGKLHYFGRWGRIVNGKMTRLEGDGWKEALEEYKVQADDLHAGRTPRAKTGEMTVGDLCNRFFTAKTRALEAGEITTRTLTDYTATTDRLVSAFGKTRLVVDLATDDFEKLRAELAKQYGPVRLGNEIQKIRTVFKYGYESGHFDNPVRYGPTFKKPSKSVMRKHRVAAGPRLFEVDDLHRVIEAAGVPLKAMILLGINAGFGNSDVANLPQTALDLTGGWLRFPRPKTGVERRCPLWPATIEALKAALAERPEHKDDADAGLVFVTKYGNRWVRTHGPEHTVINSVQLEFGKVLRSLGIKGRKGVGFYTLRHTFRTIADATRDFPAVRLIMGHADGSIDDVYRERIDDSRLRAVTEYVREWLFGKAKTAAT
jgi:integrase